MNQTLFQFAVLLHPAKQNTILIVAPTSYLCSNRQTVEIYAARLIPDEYLDCLHEIEILIKNFNPQVHHLSGSGTIVSSWTPFDYSGNNDVTTANTQYATLTNTTGSSQITLSNFNNNEATCYNAKTLKLK